MPDYPECDKLGSVVTERNACVEFVEWLTHKGIQLCSIPEAYDHTYLPICQNSEALVHEFLEIDEKALERERRAMLAALGAS